MTSYAHPEKKSIEKKEKSYGKDTMNAQKRLQVVDDKRIEALRFIECSGWLTLSKSVASSRKYTANEKVVYAYLLFKSHISKQIASNLKISELLKISEKKVSQAIKGLTEKGLIKIMYSCGNKERIIADIKQFSGERLFYLPMVILYDESLSFSSKMVYAYLLSCCYQKKICFPGLKVICQETGYSSRTIYKTMEELHDKKIIRRIPHQDTEMRSWVHELESIRGLYGNALDLSVNDFEIKTNKEYADKINGLKNYKIFVDGYDSCSMASLEENGIAHYLRQYGFEDLLNYVAHNEHNNLNGLSFYNQFPVNFEQRLGEFEELMFDLGSANALKVPGKNNSGVRSVHSWGSISAQVIPDKFTIKGIKKKFKIKKRKKKILFFSQPKKRSVLDRNPKSPNPFSPATKLCIGSVHHGEVMSEDEKTPSQKRREEKLAALKSDREARAAKLIEAGRIDPNALQPSAFTKAKSISTNVVSMSDYKAKESDEGDVMKQRILAAKLKSKEEAKTKREELKTEKSNRLDGEDKLNHAMRTMPVKLHEAFFEGAKSIGHIVNKEIQSLDYSIWKNWLKRLSADGYLHEAQLLVEFFFENYLKIEAVEWKIKKTANIKIGLFCDKDITSTVIAMFLKEKQTSKSSHAPVKAKKMRVLNVEDDE